MVTHEFMFYCDGRDLQFILPATDTTGIYILL